MADEKKRPRDPDPPCAPSCKTRDAKDEIHDGNNTSKDTNKDTCKNGNDLIVAIHDAKAQAAKVYPCRQLQERQVHGLLYPRSCVSSKPHLLGAKKRLAKRAATLMKARTRAPKTDQIGKVPPCRRAVGEGEIRQGRVKVAGGREPSTPAGHKSGKSQTKRRTDLRWADLTVGEPLEVLYEGTWYQASVSESFSSFESGDRVEVRYDGHPEDQAYEEIEKGENGAWKRRLRAPLPALHLYGLRCIEVKGKQQGIRKEYNRRFKCYGSVRDKRKVRAKPVDEVCAKTQRILRQYHSLTKAAEQLGMHKASLRTILIQRRVLEGSYFRYGRKGADAAPTSPKEPANILPVCATRAASAAKANAEAGRKKTKQDRALAELAFINPGVKAAVAVVAQSTPSSSAGSGEGGSHRSSSAGGSTNAGNKCNVVSVARRFMSGGAAPQAKNLRRCLMDRPPMSVSEAHSDDCQDGPPPSKKPRLDVAEREAYLKKSLIKWFAEYGEYGWYFRGVVRAYDAESDVYKIAYEDDEEQDMTYAEVESLVLRNVPGGDSKEVVNNHGRWYVAAENDTPRRIAKKLGQRGPEDDGEACRALQAEQIVELNRMQYPALVVTSKLQNNTMLFLGTSEEMVVQGEDESEKEEIEEKEENDEEQSEEDGDLELAWGSSSCSGEAFQHSFQARYSLEP